MRTFILALVGALVLLVVPVNAGASIALTGPTGSPVVAPGGSLAITWSGACPAGKLCGLWNYTTTDPGAIVAYGMGSTPYLSPSGVVQLRNVGEVGDGWSNMTTSPFTLAVADTATAGAWNLVVSWNECDPLKPGAVNLGTCPQAQSSLMPYVVRAVIGLPGADRAARIFRQGSTKTPRGKWLLLRTTFGCNAPAANYVGTLRVEQRVKVNGKFAWRQLAKRTNLKVVSSTTSACGIDQEWRIPDSVKPTTQLRYSYQLATRGVTPAAPVRTLTSRPFPRNNIGVGEG